MCVCACVCVCAGLSVLDLDTCSSMNKPAHLTTNYNTELLVVRRGFEVFFKVTFSQPLREQDNFQMEFLIGEGLRPLTSDPRGRESRSTLNLLQARAPPCPRAPWSRCPSRARRAGGRGI